MEGLRYFNVQRPMGIVLYALWDKWKKPRFYDPGFNVWRISQETKEDIIKIGTEISQVPVNAELTARRLT